MKRGLIAPILGIALSVGISPSSRANGYVFFENYGISPTGWADEARITYALSNVPAGKAGLGVDSSFTAALYYALGTTTDPNALTLLAPQTGYTDPNFGGGYGNVLTPYPTPMFDPPFDGPGLFLGPLVEIPGYTSGPVTFQVVAYNGSSYDSSPIRGASALFTLPSLETQPPVAGHPEGIAQLWWGYGAEAYVSGGLAPFTVEYVPEPSASTVAVLATTIVLSFARRNGTKSRS